MTGPRKKPRSPTSLRWFCERQKDVGGASSAPPGPCFLSPDKFRADLTDAWIAGIRDVTEVAVADVPGWISKLRVIEDVEELTSNLEMHSFIERDYLRYAKIGIVDSGTVEEPPV